MGNIFNQDGEITDILGHVHTFFTNYPYKGEKFVVTFDGKVFYKTQGSHIEVSAELSQKIMEDMTHKRRDVIEFIDGRDI